LYMHWAGLDDPTRVASFLDFWAFFDGARFVPAWTDLEDNSIASYDAPQGFHAVIDLTRAGRSDAPARVTQPTLRADQDYYSSTLFLLSHLARKETPS
ncbi:MAG: glycosyl hydrolase family 8, partial [Acidobacteriota bacterium]